MIAIVVRENGSDTYYYTDTDHLGSILTLTINGKEVNLHLVDATGRLFMKKGIVPSTNQHHEEVDMSRQTTGGYFMQVSSPQQQLTLKVLKISQ